MRRLEWNGDLRPAAIALLAFLIGYDCARLAGHDVVAREAEARLEEQLVRMHTEAIDGIAKNLKAGAEAAGHARRPQRTQALRTAALSAVEGGAERMTPAAHTVPTLALSSPPPPTPASLSPALSPLPPRAPTIESLRPGSGTPARDTLADGSPCPYCPQMIAAPAGTFTMGASASEPRQSHYDGREEPRHSITFARPFAIARHPVTRAEFAAFVLDTGIAVGANCQVWNGARWLQQKDSDWSNPGFAQEADHPVVCVSWDDAKRYAAWISEKTGKSYRLLSEAEREYATRAGTSTAYWWGETIAKEQANFDADVWYTSAMRPDTPLRKKTTSVTRYAPNAWGLMQMHGNVWEWCEDTWHRTHKDAPEDGSARMDGTASLRAIRGGSWFNSAEFLRAAMRDARAQTHRDSSIGFRLARTIAP